MAADQHSNPPLEGHQIAVITPTKGRHKQLRCLLTTLAAQSLQVGQIIIADGGRDAEALVDEFTDQLPVEWLDCPEPGQVIQRNLALTKLKDEIRVIVYFDDDIQLSKRAVETFVDFWNAQDQEPGGVSFNLTNMPNQPDSWFRHLFCMGSRPKGRVLKSGYNTPAVNISEDLESQWLIGGATGWRRDVLFKFRNPNLPSKWAITEDLMFSYPVHKAGEKLFVCAGADGKHIDDTPVDAFQAGVFRGRAAILWRCMFMRAHDEFSSLQFYWMMLGQIIGRMGQGIFRGTHHFGYAWGYVIGLGSCLHSAITQRPISDYIA